MAHAIIVRAAALIAILFALESLALEDNGNSRLDSNRQFKAPQWGSGPKGGGGKGEAQHDIAPTIHSRRAEGETPSIWFQKPAAGSDILSAPFLVKMGTSGFRVPEDGEVRLTMVYEGRGQQVRVLQSLEFMCWNVVQAPLTIEAQLVSTKDEKIGEAATLNVNQNLDTFFYVSAPTDGDLFFASRPISVLFLLSGFGQYSELVSSGNICVHLTCAGGGGTSEARVCSAGEDGVGLSVEGGSYKMSLSAKPGNCTMSITIFDSNGGQVGSGVDRRFWVVDEQAECPPGSGVACLYGWCDDLGGGTCVCEEGYHGSGCAVKDEGKGVSEALKSRRRGIAGRYISLVKDALLDTLYAKDRPGETAVVARSMVGRKGLDDLETFVWDVLDAGVPGDFMETGVWQGGSCILMRAVLEASGEKDKKVWVVDSFEGCPVPKDAQYPQDAGDKHHTFKNLAVPLAKVQSNFADFGLLDHRVEFVSGWFENSMNSPRMLSIESIALLRLDGDLYQSTYEVLRGIYHKVSIGGLVIVDDWRLDGMQARSAVIDFHLDCNLTEKIHVGSDGLAWWRKLNEGKC